MAPGRGGWLRLGCPACPVEIRLSGNQPEPDHEGWRKAPGWRTRPWTASRAVRADVFFQPTTMRIPQVRVLHVATKVLTRLGCSTSRPSGPVKIGLRCHLHHNCTVADTAVEASRRSFMSGSSMETDWRAASPIWERRSTSGCMMVEWKRQPCIRKKDKPCSRSRLPPSSSCPSPWYVAVAFPR